MQPNNPDKAIRQISFKQKAKEMPLAQRNPALAAKIDSMRLEIAPIVHIQTGLPPSVFPLTMLQFFSLTESELDSMAEYYSQVSPPPSLSSLPYESLKYAYPQTMDWTCPFLSNDPTLPENCRLNDLERLKVKMRMFARFIGMKGAETPNWEYERQVEILRNKIEWIVREEHDERTRRKANPWSGRML